MSIEKLRKDINTEKQWYEAHDVQHAEHDVAPDFSQWFDVLLALLDEHEKKHSGIVTLCTGWAEAEEAIQRYGESE